MTAFLAFCYLHLWQSRLYTSHSFWESRICFFSGPAATERLLKSTTKITLILTLYGALEKDPFLKSLDCHHIRNFFCKVKGTINNHFQHKIGCPPAAVLQVILPLMLIWRLYAWLLLAKEWVQSMHLTKTKLQSY